MSPVPSPFPTPAPSAIRDVSARGEEAGGQAPLTLASLGCPYLKESFSAFRNSTLRDGFASGDSGSSAQGTHRVEGRAARGQGNGWREIGGGIARLELVRGKRCRGTPTLVTRPIRARLVHPRPSPCHPLGAAWGGWPSHIPLIGVLEAGPAHPPLWRLGFEVNAERALAVSSLLSFRLL